MNADVTAIFAALGPVSAGPDPTIEERRAWMERLGERFPPAADVVFEDTTVAGVPCESVHPPGVVSQEQGLMLYLHGGGYGTSSARTHRDLVSRLARAAAVPALAVNYRLAPEYPFPAALEDAVAVYRGLIEAGQPPGGIVIAGDSAGGGLVLSTLLALRDAGVPLPAAGACISPWTDLTLSGASLLANAGRDPLINARNAAGSAARYAGGQPLAHPLISPLFGAFEGLPPLLLQVGTHECFLDDTLRLAERASAAGVDVTVERFEGMTHIWPYFAAVLPQGQQAIDRMGAFMAGRLAAAG
ncbi:MAG: alpha/beta hydrolase [Burkholderiales bacterium]